MKVCNYLTKLPQETRIRALRLFLVFLLFSPVFLISSPVYLEELLSFLVSPQSFSLLFPGVSPKLLIILVSTRFFSSSSLFSGVPDSCH